MIKFIPIFFLLFTIAGFIINSPSYHGNSVQINDSLIVNSDSLFIAEGQVLYEKKCKKCHALYNPADYKLKVWKENLKEMKYKAELNNEEYRKILAYLAKNCKK